MKPNTRFLTIAALGAALSVSFAADITGKVTLTGTPPPERPLPLDAMCSKLHEGEKPTTRFYATGAGAGLADVVVHITDSFTGKTFPVPEKAAELDQKGCEYIPYVLGVQTMQKIDVKNSDPVLHNVHTTPTVEGNKEQNKAQMPKGPDMVFSFEKPEPFLRFKCDVHNWMFAYVFVSDNPYFCVTDKDGNFKIANVPAGKYTVEAWHRKAGKTSQEVTVGATGAKADFTLSVPK